MVLSKFIEELKVGDSIKFKPFEEVNDYYTNTLGIPFKMPEISYEKIFNPAREMKYRGWNFATGWNGFVVLIGRKGEPHSTTISSILFERAIIKV